MDLKLNVSKKGLSTQEEVINEEYTLRYGHIFRGKSAYEYAVEGGFVGSEEEYEAYVGNIGNLSEEAKVATIEAKEAAIDAQDAREQALVATDMAISASRTANQAAQDVTTAKAEAEQATERANEAATNANDAWERAITAAEQAEDATLSAKDALGEVNASLEEFDSQRNNYVQNDTFTETFDRVVAAIDWIENNKVDKVEGKGLSTNDFTDEYKKKVEEFNGGITIDKELSPTSDNAIANSAVVQGLAGLAEGVSEAIGNVAKNVEQNTADIKTKQDTLTLTTKPNGNIVIGNLAGQTKEFMPATPSGDPMHYVYEAAGAVWNASTGHWELNGVSPIDIVGIYSEKYNACGPSGLSTYWRVSTQKTNICNCTWGQTGSLENTFIAASEMEVIKLAKSDIDAVPNNLTNTFRNCRKLKTIVTPILAQYVNSFPDTFYNCSLLEYVRIKSLKTNISFANSPLLSKESLLYMINNCASNAKFTITLHPDVYAKCTRVDEGEGQYIGEWWDEIDDALGTAIENKNTTITLASA